MTDNAKAAHALKVLSKRAPNLVLASLLERHPESVEFGNDLDRLCEVYREKGVSRLVITTVMATAAGHAAGDGIDIHQNGAGLAAESFTDVLCNMLRYASTEGFARQMKERVNGKNNGA